MASGAIAARAVGKPVKLVLGREQMFGPVGHRAPTRQTLRLGTNQDGKLIALDHRTKTMSSTFDDFFEPASGISHALYASTAIATSHEVVRNDVGTPMFMRAPGEATGSVALESAIGVLLYQMGIGGVAVAYIIWIAFAPAARMFSTPNVFSSACTRAQSKSATV